MIFIVAALQCEAQSLIHHFGLKPVSNSKWRVYQSDKLTLILSGTGKIRSAMAACYLYSHAEDTHLNNSFTINIGMCGATDPGMYNIGDLVVINQVLDNGNQRRYFPDMIVHHGFKEAGIESFDRPVIRASPPTMPLVDMEAAGFFEAASLYFSPDRILCLKLVSDYLEGRRILSEAVTNLFDNHMTEIARLIGDFNKTQYVQPEIINAGNQQLITEIGHHLKFSITQRHQLKMLTEGYLIRHNSDLEFLKEFLHKEVVSKYEAKQYFNTIKSLLSKP